MNEFNRRRFKELDKIKIRPNHKYYPNYEGVVYHRQLIFEKYDLYGHLLPPNELLRQSENQYKYGVSLLKDDKGNKCQISWFFTDNDIDLIK